MSEEARRRDIWVDGMRRAVASLGTLAPPKEPRWPIALQTTIVLAVPLILGAALDRFELGLIACVGAFTVPYFAALPRLERLRLRPLAGLVLIASSALGSALGPYPLAAAAGLAAVATAVGAAVHGYRLGPPGPLFPVIVYGMSAHAVAGGESPLTLVGWVAAGCAFAVIASIAPLIRRTHWHVEPRPLRVLLAPPEWDRGARELVIRTAIVAVVGTAVSLLYTDPERAYWTVAAGVVVVGIVPGRGIAVSRGLHRTVGTLAGALAFLAIGSLPPNPWLLAAILAALQFITEMSITRHYAVATAAVTPLALTIVTSATGDFGTHAVIGERVLDTVVGAGLAVLTALVHAPGPPGRPSINPPPRPAD
ncbi:FUSC family protein [Demequina lignilytica]|uniref:FUSC family protein n=1 Tax=Demequina lignilytica TaxID=3051663 RepID=A0AAW7M3A6_9MICO|nr:MULTISPECIES: FUSC family protein [unclassified Demequina]MDN4479209.1 FUSC family protein [Demequina sp. SYSU T00039-1]MDN4484435.1 FUSC family protein [Demequina sp. SYSU T0a273]MDN4487932.1 FUSC family protein [Demequina sp. SYSU T00039]MDN4491738.1 FUSC family protein [Demequina sp. SYSU T00068]